MKYMIERQYGGPKKNLNRDWLAVYGPGDESTVWVCGPKRAMILSNIEAARLMLDRVKLAAEKWENSEEFNFVVIEDRTALPSYFASTVA